MKHSVTHDLGQERAKKVAESALATDSQKDANYHPQVTWKGPNQADISFKVKGLSLSGSLEVLDRSIDLDMDVPFLLRPFKSQALGVIEGEINDWIKKAKAAGG
ncbi:MAG TPA: polyhydroxyalkanoic acid system family protein [Polyangiaceae bacterium]